MEIAKDSVVKFIIKEGIETWRLKKLTLSELCLVILDSKYSDETRSFAKCELNRRFRNCETSLEEILEEESKGIEKRGLNSANYLFGPNPNMQLLMETYFQNFHKTGNYMLFSEYHICNDIGGLFQPFFNNIVDVELQNIARRLQDGSIASDDRVSLEQAKKVLEKRQKDYKQFCKDVNVFEVAFLSDTFEQADRMWIDDFTYHGNISEEEQYKRMKTKFGFHKEEFLSDHLDDILDFDLFQEMIILKRFKADERKLGEQKRVLKQQAKNGFKVDYRKIV